MLISHTALDGLKGVVRVPGDKSISHRALIFGALAHGKTTVTGLLTGEDVLATAAALQHMGVHINLDQAAKTVSIQGVGFSGFKPPAVDLDMGNSGTSARLMMGLVAGLNIPARFIGDASLSKRPMARVAAPLAMMGANIVSEYGDKMTLPLTVQKSLNPLKPLFYQLPVASAQVKSAILLAGLVIDGETVIIEPTATRDHSENMLKAMGADIDIVGTEIRLRGGKDLKAMDFMVPGDPSAAAFLTVAALITPGSDIVLKNVGMNPRRSGLYETLKEMGGHIQFENERHALSERIVDLHVRYSKLNGVQVPALRAPSMIDEYPVLFVAASCAKGKTDMQGLRELRVKESDRLTVMAEGLKQQGVTLTYDNDSMQIFGTGQPPQGGGPVVKTALDHRIAMSFLTLGCATLRPITIDDAAPIATSFPDFVDIMGQIGAQFYS